MSKKNFLEIGRIVRTHGIKGDVKIMPWCDDSSIITGLSHLFFDCEGKSFKHIENAKILKNAVIVNFVGINSIECAKEIVGKIVYVNRNDIVLSDGVYFIQDLIGMRVYDVDNNSEEVISENHVSCKFLENDVSVCVFHTNIYFRISVFECDRDKNECKENNYLNEYSSDYYNGFLFLYYCSKTNLLNNVIYCQLNFHKQHT